MSLKKLDLIGQRYGRLTVSAEAPTHYDRSGNPKRYVFCICDCGNNTKNVVGNLRNGHTKSCGCLETESRYGRLLTHGESHPTSTEYRVWCRIIARCENPTHDKWKYYGGRGISVCAQWRSSYEDFLKDMGRRPHDKTSIDRINNNGNYEPGNCRWATQSEQMRNTRRSLRTTGEIIRD